MVDGELLALVRAQLGIADLTYAEPPQRFPGGFFTENHAFRLAAAPPPWDGPLVLRLFPSALDRDDVRREAVVQRGVAAQHYPTARVIHFDEDARVAGRQLLVMDRLPGAPLMGDVDLKTVIRRGPQLLRSLVRTTADVQAALHRLDPAPIVDALDGVPITVERWFASLRQIIDDGAGGLVEGLRWLIEHRPKERAEPVLCHGDLWPGNILVDDRGNLTGVIDWTVATVAEPALEVGFTRTSLSLAPIAAPPVVQRLAARIGRGLANRYVKAYQRIAPCNLEAVPYYEALRCAFELAGVAAHRLSLANGARADRPTPAWDPVAGAMVEYFRDRSGVELRLPAAPAAA